MAGKIIADIIEAPFDSIKMNVANVTVLTANNSGLTYLPTGNVNINVGSTTSLTLGNVTVSNLITANGGIKFPATQVASADVNTLDDYEEGTWTPVAAVSGFSTAINTLYGKYTKIGNVVTVHMRVLLSSTGRPTTYSQFTGLPFSVGTADNIATCTGVFAGSNAGTGIQGGSISVNSTSLFWYATNGTTNSDNWWGTVTYQV